MERSIYRYILNHSFRQQLVVLALTAVALPFYYASLELPKRIVNEAISAASDRFPKGVGVFGFKLADLTQIEFLIVLCGVFLLLVVVNGAFKYVINVYKGLLGERMLRRLRYRLFSFLLRFPMSRYRRISPGEMVSSIASEVEPLGGFIGDAFSLPLYQGGLLLTALLFIFAQDPLLGGLVVALYPLQAIIIPRLQYRVNMLGRQRVREVRTLSNKITETIQMARDIRTLDTDAYERAHFTHLLGRIFDIRYDIYRKKFFIKFLNNFLAQLSRLFIFSIGGYLVIVGKLTLGELVAVLAAYKDLAPPWKELLDYYQMQQDARIRYEQIVLLFDVEDLQAGEEGVNLEFDATAVPGRKIVARDLTASDDGVKQFGPLSIELDAGESTSIVGDARSGNRALAAVVAGTLEPAGGAIRLDDVNLLDLPSWFVRRELAFADGEPEFFSGTIFENLIYGQKRRAHVGNGGHENSARSGAELASEALMTGNSEDEFDGSWIDLVRFDLASADQLPNHALHMLNVCGMGDELFSFGLRTVVDADALPQLAPRLLEARRKARLRLGEFELAGLVAPFDRNHYNDALSVGENLIFGEPVGDALDHHRMADNRYVRRVLEKTGLEDELVGFGYDVAASVLTGAEAPDEGMVVDFIGEEDLRALRTILAKRPRSEVLDLPRRDRRRLESVPLELIAARHAQHPIGAELKERIVSARRVFEAGLPDDLRLAIAFFDEETYNPVLTVQENIIFGKVVAESGDYSSRLQRLLETVIDELGLREIIVETGLSFDIGSQASRLSLAQRQQLGLARAIFGLPRFLILSDPLSALDDDVQMRIIAAIRAEFSGRGVLCALPSATLAEGFDRVLQFRGGVIVDDSRNAIDSSPPRLDPEK